MAPPLPFFGAAPRSTTRGVATLRVTTTEEPVYTTVGEALGHLIRGLVRSGRYAPGARHYSYTELKLPNSKYSFGALVDQASFF